MFDYPDTILDLPANDDWHGWVAILTRDDTGRIDCVHPCLRRFCEDVVGEDGRINVPGLVPSTPYDVARFMLMDHPLPWRGTGFSAETVRTLLARGIPGDAIIETAKELGFDQYPHPMPFDFKVERKLQNYTPQRPVLPLKRAYSVDLYMIQSGDGPIKIGISAAPARRLKDLQTAHPYPLKIVCLVKGGGAELEAHYHERFAAHRLHGEWFEPHEEILAEIARLTATPKED